MMALSIIQQYLPACIRISSTFINEARIGGLEYQVPLQLSLLWKQLMLRIAELVPRHPGRTKKQEPASASNAGTSKSGKGGKKKRWLHFHIVAEDFSSSGTQQAWMGILK